MKKQNDFRKNNGHYDKCGVPEPTERDMEGISAAVDEAFHRFFAKRNMAAPKIYNTNIQTLDDALLQD